MDIADSRDTERRVKAFYSELEPLIEKLLNKFSLADKVLGVKIQIELLATSESVEINMTIDNKEDVADLIDIEDTKEYLD